MPAAMCGSADRKKLCKYCTGQFAEPEVPEELPTAPITTSVQMLAKPDDSELGFDKFNFDGEESAYD